MPNHTVGIVLPYLKHRGTEKQALGLATSFSNRGLKVVVFVLQGWGTSDMYHAFEDASIQVVNVGPPIDVGSKKASITRSIPLATLAQRHGCSVLISRAGMTNRATGLAGLLARTPSVTVLSGCIPPPSKQDTSFKRSLKTLLHLYRLGLPWRIVCVSKEGARNFAGASSTLSRKTRAIQNGVSLPSPEANISQPGKKNSELTFCYCGSLELKRKGLDTLINAFSTAQNHYGLSTARLTLIGSGEDETEIKRLINDRELDCAIHMAGEQSDPLPLMSSCDVFVLPSRKEGLPNTLLEAMSLGMPVISTDCDTGPREIISDRHDGLLVPPDNPKALASALAELYFGPDLRDQLGNNARNTVEQNFSYEKMIDQYLDLVTSA